MFPHSSDGPHDDAYDLLPFRPAPERHVGNQSLIKKFTRELITADQQLPRMLLFLKVISTANYRE